jgi:hypothetical protein
MRTRKQIQAQLGDFVLRFGSSVLEGYTSSRMLQPYHCEVLYLHFGRDTGYFMWLSVLNTWIYRDKTMVTSL